LFIINFEFKKKLLLMLYIIVLIIYNKICIHLNKLSLGNCCLLLEPVAPELEKLDY
jgi:hypothetical protein